MRKKALREVDVQGRHTKRKNENDVNIYARCLYHSRRILEGDEHLSSSTLYLELTYCHRSGKRPTEEIWRTKKQRYGPDAEIIPRSLPPPSDPSRYEYSRACTIAPCHNNTVNIIIGIINHQQRPGAVHCFARPLDRSTGKGSIRGTVRRSVMDTAPERSIPSPQPSPEANRARQSADKMRAL